MNILMEIKNLSVGYEDTILKQLNFSLIEKSFIPILGSNGIGKTTLIKTLFNLIPKKEGEVLLLGKNIDFYSHQELAELISISLSEFLNTGLMSCEDFVGLGTYNNKQHNSLEYVSRILEKLNITALAERPFSSLSDGQKEWVKLARVLAQDTKIVFLDEPMSHLDIAGKVKMMHLLENISQEENKCILMSSHDWSTIRKFSKWVYVINEKGEMSFESPEDLIIKKDLNKIYSLGNEDYFEDQQGEISINIPLKFCLDINFKENNESMMLQKFWLEHSLRKLGYSQMHSALNGNLINLPNITISKDGFLFEEQIFNSIADLILNIQKKYLSKS